MKAEILKYFNRPQRSWGKVMFLHVSVILFMGGMGGWWYASMHCSLYPSMPCSRSPGWGDGIPAYLAGFQAHIQGEVEGSSQGGSPGTHPRGRQAHTWGSPGPHLGWSPGPHPGRCVSQHALRQTPPQRLLLWTVCIILECILVLFMLDMKELKYVSFIL